MVWLSLLWFPHTKCRAFYPSLVLLLTSVFFSINNVNFLCRNIENRANRGMWFWSSDILVSAVKRWSRLTWFYGNIHNFTAQQDGVPSKNHFLFLVKYYWKLRWASFFVFFRRRYGKGEFLVIWVIVGYFSISAKIFELQSL